MSSNFEIIPAIDILDGKCVRLTQGNYSKKEEFFKDPIEVAKKWLSQGAKRIHVVDLNGAKTGYPQNKDIILKLIKLVNIEIEVGGGVRSIHTIKEYIQGGAKYIVLGTKAFEDENFLNEALNLYQKKIIIGLDIKNDRIALSGWDQVIEINFNKLKKKLASVGQIIYTDVNKDGMLCGPNLNSIKKISNSFHSKVIISGGVSSLDDIRSILQLKYQGHHNIAGVILGKSLYKGNITLSSAIELTKNYKE